MSTILDNPISESLVPETLADVISQLGDIPLDRIRWKPFPGTATIEDAVCAGHCELIDGILVEKAVGQFEGRIGQVIAWYLELWLSVSKLGFVIGEGAMTRMRTGNMRIPDAYVVRWDRLPEQRVPEDPVTNVIPHVAIEVLSQGNTAREIERKRNEFFENGTEQVWIVRPKSKTVDIWDSRTTMKTLTISDQLEGGTSLPGFSLPVQEIFDGAQRGSIDVHLARSFLADPGTTPQEN